MCRKKKEIEGGLDQTKINKEINYEKSKYMSEKEIQAVEEEKRRKQMLELLKGEKTDAMLNRADHFIDNY